MPECTIYKYKWAMVKWFSIFLIDLTRSDTNQRFIKSFNTWKNNYFFFPGLIWEKWFLITAYRPWALATRNAVTAHSSQSFLAWLPNDMRFTCTHSVCPSICRPSLRVGNGPLHIGVSARGSTSLSLTHCELALHLTPADFPAWTVLVSALPREPPDHWRLSQA